MAQMMSQREFNFDKKKNFSEWYNTLIYAAGLVDSRYNVQGFVVHKPWSVKAFSKMYELFEKELEGDGHEKVIFPSVIPEENFEKEKEHVKGFVPEVFWVTEAGGEKLARKLALRPTSETAFYQMYSLWVQSENELPLKLYQSCSVFRFEHETLPFIRGREFLWIESHDAFATEKEAQQQVERDVKTGRLALTERLGIPLMVLQRPHWDTFPGAEHTIAYDVLMPDGKALQVGSTHLLGQNFSKAFNIKYKKTDGSGEEFAWQTCFGPGIWRMMAAVAGVHGDDKGLVFPPAIAPLEVVIVPIFRGDGSSVIKYARDIAVVLERHGVRVRLDAREKTPGFKYNEWEMKGVPLRCEIGEREMQKQQVTLVRRDNRQKKVVDEKNLIAEVRKLEEVMLDQLRAKAETELNSRIKPAKNISETSKALQEGYARIAICSLEEEGTECGKKIQEQTAGGKVRGESFGAKEKPGASDKCVACGRKAGAVAYVARQY